MDRAVSHAMIVQRRILSTVFVRPVALRDTDVSPRVLTLLSLGWWTMGLRATDFYFTLFRTAAIPPFPLTLIVPGGYQTNGVSKRVMITAMVTKVIRATLTRQQCSHRKSRRCSRLKSRRCNHHQNLRHCRPKSRLCLPRQLLHPENQHRSRRERPLLHLRSPLPCQRKNLLHQHQWMHRR